MRQEGLKKLFKDDRCSGGGLNRFTENPVKAKRHFSWFVWAQDFSFLIANCDAEGSNGRPVKVS
jgi:hypothetical protein